MWRLGALSAVVIGAAVVVLLLERAPPADAHPAVEARAGGVVLLDGKAVRLADLSGGCRGRGAATLRVEDPVPWAHVVWMLLALQAAGGAEVRFDLPDGVVTACFVSDYWTQDVRHVLGGHAAGLVAVHSDEMAEPLLAGRLAEETARIARESGLRPLAHVFPEPAQPFSAVASALRALRDARLELEFPLFGFVNGEAPDVSLLPPPWDLPAGAEQYVGWQCACRPGIRDIDLPVADMGEQDQGQEQDDRLILQLDRDGRLFGKDEGSLDDLAAFLRERRDRYDLKMRQQGKSGFEQAPDDTLSRLYVLIRADRSAPAHQVGWILRVLAQEGFYKVQFAVRRELGEEPGPCTGALGAKLYAFLPTDNLPDIVSRDEGATDVRVGPRDFGIGEVRALEAESLEKLARADSERARADPTKGKIVVAVHVAPGVAWERVIAAVNEVSRAGVQKVDFWGLPPPDAATRRMSPLPRWR